MKESCHHTGRRQVYPSPAAFASRRAVIIPLAVTLAAACATAPVQTVDAGARPLAIVGATLIDGTGGAPVPSSVVLVRDGAIAAVGRAGEVEVPVDADRIDADGRFLLPGFIDAHAHVGLGPVSVEAADGMPAFAMDTDPEVSERSLLSLLAHGITTVRDPGGPAEWLVHLREAVASGAMTGPELRVAGEVIDQSEFRGLTEMARTPEEVRAAVRRQAAVGVDFVKLYVSLPPELVAGGIDEARAHGLPAVGHLMATTWTRAAELGIDGILHIIPGSPELLPADAVPQFMESMGRGTQFMVTWFELADFDAPPVQEAIRTLARHGVVVDPTLVFFDTMVRADDPAITGSADLDLVPAALLENWRMDFHMNFGWTADDFERGRAALPRMQELARRLHEGGVTLAAGTDANNPWVVPGPSFHRELELLVEAGISTNDVLVIATRNGARAAGLLHDRGTVEPGKRADLVLLDRDPRADIRATREIAWVMQRGRLIDRDALLARARRD